MPKAPFRYPLSAAGGLLSDVRHLSLMAEVRFGMIISLFPAFREKPTMRDRKTHKTFAFACAAIAALAVAIPAGPALAQASRDSRAAVDPTTQQYADSLTGAENSAGANQPGTSPASGQSGGEDGGGGIGALPFTGTDLIGLGAIAVAMLATGFLLSSLARPRRQ